MSSLKRAKIYSSKRLNLSSVLPLETPLSVEIDICSICNFACKFCFQHDKESLKKYAFKLKAMEYGLFTKLVDDICNFPQKPKKLKLFEFGEPLLNKNIGEMICYAKSVNCVEAVEITTNGSLLTPTTVDSIIDAGIDRINISIEAMNDSDYCEITGKNIKFSDIVSNVKYLYNNKKNCIVYVKIADINLSQTERERFYEVFQNISDEMYIEHISPIWRGTDSVGYINDDGIGSYGQVIKSDKKICTFLFTRLVINSDGEAVLCCVDWKSQYIIGDAKKESLYNIWNGNALKSLQLKHLNLNKDKIEICSNCNVYKTSTIDDIDSGRESILSRFERKDEVK
ncbi:MAG: SPASM domain-containing protein [Ruminococcus sp.]|nr:SPASM domain-containing protein [Ruminococcus sp.]